MWAEASQAFETLYAPHSWEVVVGLCLRQGSLVIGMARILQGLCSALWLESVSWATVSPAGRQRVSGTSCLSPEQGKSALL